MSSYRGKRHYLRSRGHATYRLIRYADDFVVLVKGTGEQAQALLSELTARVEGLGLRLAPAKTGITHIDEGFGFWACGSYACPKDPNATSTPSFQRGVGLIKRKVKALTGRSTTTWNFGPVRR